MLGCAVAPPNLRSTVLTKKSNKKATRLGVAQVNKSEISLLDDGNSCELSNNRSKEQTREDADADAWG